MIQHRFRNKVSVITGAGGELCSALSVSLGSRGALIALIGRDINKLTPVEKEIRQNGGTAVSVSADVSSLDSVRKAHDIIIKELGQCNVLINGAGGNQSAAITTINEFDKRELEQEDGLRGFFNLDMELFRSVININTMGTVIPCQVFGRDMAANGGGAIINFASMTSYRPLSRVGAYAIAKTGIAMFTQWLAAYLAPANIRVNAIAPGFFPNNRSRELLMTPDGGYTNRGEKIIKNTPMKHFGKAGDLIGTVNFLLDENSSGFITGTVIPVDGGFLASPII